MRLMIAATLLLLGNTHAGPEVRNCIVFLVVNGSRASVFVGASQETKSCAGHSDTVE